MKKLFKDLQEIDNLVGQFYQQHPEYRQSKFGYAYKRYSEKTYAPIVSEFRDELQAIRIENALEDKSTGEILTDASNNRGYKYSKEGLLGVIKAENVLMEKYNLKEVEIIPFVTKECPEELSDELKEMLKGVIL